MRNFSVYVETIHIGSQQNTLLQHPLLRIKIRVFLLKFLQVGTNQDINGAHKKVMDMGI